MTDPYLPPNHEHLSEAAQRQLSFLIESEWGSKHPVRDQTAIEAQRERIRAAEARPAELKAEWQHALERRIEMLGGPGQPVRKVLYRFYKWKMIELEIAIERAKRDAELERQNLILMLPWQHKPRRAKRKPTKYVRDESGNRIPMRGK